MKYYEITLDITSLHVYYNQTNPRRTKMTNAISNTDNTIDSRDVIARIEELEAARDLEGEIQYGEESNPTALEEFDNSEEGQELTALKALAEQGEDYAPDWEYGAQLIHEDYFEEAMDELLEDCGDIPKDLPSYLTITVDYDALEQDYTELDFDGQTYYIR